MEQNLDHVKQIQKQQIREVLVPTKEGKGDIYAHPANFDFDNPIIAVHQVNKNWACMLFETKDGVIGQHPQSIHSFTRVEVPQEYSMLRVWKCDDNIHCIEFVGSECTMQVGAHKDDEQIDIQIQ